MDKKIEEITARIEEKVKELFNSDKYKEYLKVMARFTNYSFNNTVLIASQRPDATLVAGYNAWPQRFGRHVKEGAKAIRIIQPSPWKKTEKQQVCNAQGKQIMDKEGHPLFKEVERTIPGYKVGYVFALEDTEGVPLPEIVKQLNEPIKDYAELKDILNIVSPVPIIEQPIESTANGFFDTGKKQIVIDETLPELQSIKTTIHEMAHAILHDKTEGLDIQADKRTKEVEAESVAYTVCSYYGLDTSDYSFGYIAGWSEGKELTELKASMDVIRKTSGQIIDSIDQQIEQRLINKQDEIAYKFGSDYLLVQKSDTGYQFSYVDGNYITVANGTINDTGQGIQVASKEAAEKLGKNIIYGQIGEASKIRNYAEIMKNTHVIKQDDTQVVKHSLHV